MNFENFLDEYQKESVKEYPNQVSPNDCLLTVRVITYNHVDFIKRCLDSILEQKTNFKFQVMLIDDASTDGTSDICKEYAHAHPELIRYFANSRVNNIYINNKPTGLFNAVYLNFLTTTKYLSFIEADDYWSDEYNLQKKIDILESNPKYSFCFSNGVRLENEKQGDGTKNMINLKSAGVIKKHDLMDLNIPTASLVFRNIIRDKFHPEMLTIPNGDILLRAKLAHIGCGYYLNNIKPVYRRVHAGGAYSSLDLDQKFEMMISTRKAIISYFAKNNWNTDFLYHNLCFILLKKIRRKLKRGRLDLSSLKDLFFYTNKIGKSKLFLLNQLVFGQKANN